MSSAAALRTPRRDGLSVPYSLCAVPLWLTQRARRLRTLTRPEDVHPDDFVRLQQHVKRARESGLPTWETLQFRRRRKDGTWAEVEASGSCECVPAARLPRQCAAVGARFAARRGC